MKRCNCINSYKIFKQNSFNTEKTSQLCIIKHNIITDFERIYIKQLNKLNQKQMDGISGLYLPLSKSDFAIEVPLYSGFNLI